MREFYVYNNPKEDAKNGENQIVEVKVQPRHFDAIIMDLNMPIMDGFEACKQICQLYEQYNEEQFRIKEKIKPSDAANH